MRVALRHADRIIANSEHTQRTLVAMGVAPERIDVIHPGVDVSVFRPGLDVSGLRESLGISAGERLVFSVGRLSRRKGFDQVVRAVARLRADHMAVRYVIAGIGEDFEHLQELIREHRLQGVVHMLGPVDAGDLARWMNACDVFAMPNRDINGDNEGFGIVFIEAAACGKPALAGEAGGTGSAVLNEATGLRVDGTSLDAVTAGLRRLLADADWAAEMGRAGERRVAKDFTWSRVAEKTVSQAPASIEKSHANSR
jgi:phosphatidylinositol alpha-1,6-mannosyltransferase